MPVDTDYAWAAGFIDGEGYFGAHERPSDRYRSGFRHSIEISVFQVDRGPLEKLHDLFGGKVTEHIGENDLKHWKWSIQSASEITKIIDHLLPYLVLKRNEAVLMRELSTLFNAPHGGRVRYDQGTWERRSQLCELIAMVRHDRKLRRETV